MKTHIAIERLLLLTITLTAVMVAFMFANTLYWSARGGDDDLHFVLAVAALVLPLGLVVLDVILSKRLSWHGMNKGQLVREGLVISIGVFALVISTLEGSLVIAYIWPFLIIGVVVFGLQALVR